MQLGNGKIPGGLVQLKVCVFYASNVASFPRSCHAECAFRNVSSSETCPVWCFGGGYDYILWRAESAFPVDQAVVCAVPLFADNTQLVLI